MAFTTINNGEDHFNTVLYSGNVDHSSANGSQSITGVGFQPDWVWIKPRTLGYAAGSHNLTDSVRGAGVGQFADLAVAEYDYGTSANGGTVTAFGADGFTLGGASQVNEDSNTYVAWNWKAATAFSNSAGSNGADLACTGRVNTTAGFSIIKATSDSAANKTIAHGLGAVPDVIWAKNLDRTYNWDCYFKVLGYNASLILNGTNTTRTGAWGSNAFTTTTFNTQENYSSTNGEAYIYYCFTSIKGYSKYGKYEGNADTGRNGPFIYTGFKPAMVILKGSDIAENWWIYDNKRNVSNLVTRGLNPSTSGAEVNYSAADAMNLDFLSNGFKIKSYDGALNGNNKHYVYMAFADNPFVSSAGVPTTAH